MKDKIEVKDGEVKVTYNNVTIIWTKKGEMLINDKCIKSLIK